MCTNVKFRLGVQAIGLRLGSERRSTEESLNKVEATNRKRTASRNLTSSLQPQRRSLDASQMAPVTLDALEGTYSYECACR
jgi:hypothetical protein